MRSRLYVFLLPVVFAVVTSCSTPRAASTAAVKTNFVPEAVLSRGELRQIIDLAHKCGISDVGEVYSYNIHPSPSCGFGVKSVETVQGREVSFIILTVDHKKWVRPRDPRIVEQASGNFWVESGIIRTNVLTTFAFAGGTARARLSGAVDLETADRIVELFTAGRVAYSDSTLKEKLGTIDVSRLEALGRSEDGTMFSITFSCGDLCAVYADFTLTADGVRVVKVDRGVS
jgi:hypothetical protein